MDESEQLKRPSSPATVPRRQFLAAVIGGSAVTFVVSGCSIGVMMGRMLTGDQLVPCEFKNLTHEDLDKGKLKVLVMCSCPEAIDAELASLKFDLIDGITRRLKLHGVDVVNPDKIATWIDDRGGNACDPQDLAKEFDVNYIAWIEVQTFTFREPNSPKLLRGQSSGYVRVFKVVEDGDERNATTAYKTEFSSVYPPHQPISDQGRSSLIFQKEYVERVCKHLAERFYDHEPGSDI